jgi:hypothetical protein
LSARAAFVQAIGLTYEEQSAAACVSLNRQVLFASNIQFAFGLCNRLCGLVVRDPADPEVLGSVGLEWGTLSLVNINVELLETK